MRQTLRSLGRARWYSATIVSVLGLAMALATTVFAIVDGVLFRPLPYPDSGQLYKIVPGFTGIDAAKNPAAVSIADLRNWVAAAPDVQLTGFSAQRWGDLGGGLNAENVAGMVRVQANIFDVLGVRPLIGGFHPEDFVQSPATRPVIATYDVWQGRFGGDTAIVGRAFNLNPDSKLRVVGVMPRGFSFPTEGAEVSFLTPMVEVPGAPGDARNFYYEVIARVPPSVGAPALRARVESGMAMAAAALPARGPKPAGTSDRAWRMQGPFDQATVAPLSSALGQKSRPLFSAVFLAVIVIVALGALNVSGLMASRVLDRAREIDVRRALGASSGSIARLIGLEALLLIGAGGAIGLLCTPALLHLALSLLPEETVLLKAGRIDWRVVLFVMIGVVALAAPTALWPIRRALRRGGASSDRSSPRVRSAGRFAVVAVQVAAAFVLTVTGSLLVGSVLSVYSNAQPIRTDHVIVLEGTSFAPDAIVNRRSPERALRLAALLDRLRQTPGVAEASITSAQVLRGGNWPSWFIPPEDAAEKRLRRDKVDVQGVMPGYFKVLKPELVAGRLPTDDELRQNARVIAVSENLARAYWPAHSPIGFTLAEGNDPPFTVVGIVKDVRWWAWDEDGASIYGPFAPLSRYSLFSVVIQASGDTGRVMEDALDTLRSADPLVTYSRAATLDHMFADSIRARRFQSWLFGSFASAALGVVGVGILGLLAMSAARRTKEVGIRQTLGATKAGIIRLFLREQLAPVAVGLVAGGCIAAWTTQFVKASLYGVTSSDVRVWAVAAALIVGVAALGTLVPEVRASRVDPAEVLRAE